MSESSLFWTTSDTPTGDGSAYTESQLFAWLRRTLLGDNAASEGPLANYANELEVSSGTGKVTVATGAAVVYGIPYENDAAKDITIATSTSNTRIDRIVLRADWSAQTVRIYRIAGTEGTTAPDITQTADTTWDVKLAQVSVTTGGVITVTDEREFAHFATKVSAAMLDDGAATGDALGSDVVTTADDQTVSDLKTFADVNGTSVEYSALPTGGAVVVKDTGGLVGNGGAVLFGAVGTGFSGIFGALKGLLADASTHNAGSLVIALRKLTGDTSLTTVMKFFASGGVAIGSSPADPGDGGLNVAGDAAVGGDLDVTGAITGDATAANGFVASTGTGQRIESGKIAGQGMSGNTTVTVDVTFATAFSAAPHVVATTDNASVVAAISSVTASGFTLSLTPANSLLSVTVSATWLAIGSA